MPDNIIQPPIPTTPVTPAVMDALRAIVGDRGLIADERDKEPFVTDWRRSRIGTASVVVRPASVEETSKVVKLCYDHGIAIVPASTCDLAVATLTGAPALQQGVKYWVVATTDENQTGLDATWYGSNNAQFAANLGYGWLQFTAVTPGFLVQ